MSLQLSSQTTTTTLEAAGCNRDLQTCFFVWRGLFDADFDVITDLKTRAVRYGDYQGNRAKECTLRWLQVFEFVEKDGQNLCFTSEGRRLASKIDKFKEMNHCFPYRLIVDVPNGGMWLSKIPALELEILNQSVFDAGIASTTFDLGFPSLEKYRAWATLVLEGRVRYDGSVWSISPRGLFAMYACDPPEEFKTLPDEFNGFDDGEIS